MRNGDVYKIQSMKKNGSSDKEVIARFQNEYSEKEVRKFLPKEKVARKKSA